MFNLRQYRERTNRLSDQLPWAALVAPGVVLQKDAVLQKTLAFRGPDLASAGSSELVSAVARLNNALRRLGSGWSLFIEAQRFEANTYPACSWRHAAGWIVDMERHRKFREKAAHYESSYYLTFVWKMPSEPQTAFRNYFYQDHDGTAQDKETSLLRDVAHFQKVVAEVSDIMRGVFPEVAELDDAQTLSYLHSTISTNRHPVATPETPIYLDALLPDMPFLPGDVPMLGDHYLATCTVTGFPGATLPGLLDALNHLQTEYRWVTRFICLDSAEAKKIIEKYRKFWWQGRKTLFTLLKEEAAKEQSALIDNAAANKAADADAALQVLGEDQVGFGFLTVTVTLWDRDFDALSRKQQLVKRTIQAGGFTVKDETLNSLQAWLGSLPGHVYANVRRPLVHSLNVAHLMPVSSVWAGDDENHHLQKVCGVGACHVYCSTTGDTPFRLNLNVGDVGHTLVIGPTGAGKSTLLGVLALQWLKYPDGQVIIFDKDRSARAATLAAGGTCYEPGNDRAPLAFQPLAGIDDRSERIWASEFILTLLAAQDVAIDPAIKTAVGDVLTILAQQERRQRTLTLFATQIASYDKRLRQALQPYTLEGPYGQTFDGDADGFEKRDWMMIEMGHLMGLGEAVVIPALEYLFHRVEDQLDGRPTLMIIDEAWLFLSHPVFASRLQAWLKTLRKKNTYVLFATQEVADALAKPELMSTILSACHTKIFLPDEEALSPAMMQAYEKVGLSRAEIQIIAKATKKRDYYYRSTKGRRLFNLDVGPATLAFVGMSSEADHRFLDDMIATTPPTDFALAMLKRRSVAWAVDELGGFEPLTLRFEPRAVLTPAASSAREPLTVRNPKFAHLRSADPDPLTIRNPKFAPRTQD